MASITNRVDEANKYMENGHKHMKTGLLKWTPDHENAAVEFAKAAKTFKEAGIHQKAIEANELAAKCHSASSYTIFQAAKCLEQAALSFKELGNYQKVSEYYMRAIDIYRDRCQQDTAITVMDRAAKTLTDKSPTLAAEMYVQASEVCAVEDRYRQAAEYCNRAAFLFVKTKNYSRAAHMLKEEYNCYTSAGDTRHQDRIITHLILVYLADKDIVAATSALKSLMISDETYQCCEQLVRGVDKRDASLIQSVLKQTIFANLDNEYAKIARNLGTLYADRKIEPNNVEQGESNNQTASGDDDLLL